MKFRASWGVCSSIGAILLIGLGTLGCEPEGETRYEQAKRKNRETLSGSGELVGVLKDGRRVVRFHIKAAGDGHTLYVVTDTPTITNNRQERQGKTMVPRAEVSVGDFSPDQ